MLLKSINIVFLIFYLCLPRVVIAQINFPTYKLPKHAITRLGKGSISTNNKAIAISPNGDRIAVATTIGIWLYNAKTYHTVDLLIGHTDSVESVTFSPNGDILASAASYADATTVKPGEIKFWLVANQSEIGSLTGHPAMIKSIAFSPNGEILGIRRG